MMNLSQLCSLTLVDLPDNDEFIDEYHHLGTGILALRPLRVLDISMTNHARPETFEDREAFVEPKYPAFFFNAFFSEPNTQQVAAHVRRMYENPRVPVQTNLNMSNQGSLNLERLRLWHVNLPYWAFQTVFNPTSIREFELLNCRVDPYVWQQLRTRRADMRALTNIRYDLLCEEFLEFVTTQRNLQSLSFARPPDTYHFVQEIDENGNPLDLLVERLHAASEFGPGTAWGRAAWRGPPWSRYQYPTSKQFANALRGKPDLRHLVIPFDMWDITPAFLGRLGAGLPGLGPGLPGLESIELGFDCLQKVCLIHPVDKAFLY